MGAAEYGRLVSRHDRERCGALLASTATAAVLALAAAGCAEPIRVVSVPKEPARTEIDRKGTGTATFRFLQGETSTPAGIPGFTFEHVATLAQSGEGTLGDRVFREDEHSMLEGCRWVAKGRVCQLVTLPDGKYLGGGVDWIIPEDAPATPRSGGWLARGLFMSATRAVTGIDTAASVVRPPSETVFVGSLYHCRFADAGPVCLPVKLETEATGYALLGAFSLRDGAARREVLWLGVFQPDLAASSDVALAVTEIHRCETTEDSTDITCKRARLP